MPALIILTACAPSTVPETGGNWAPSVDHTAAQADPLEVGQRLMSAGEYELALDAYNRAALEQGLTAEVLSSMGTANLGLGRLGQAETLLRRAVSADPDWPAALNNLGIVLLERGKTAESIRVLQRAFALDNGESDAIRDNLRLALANFENPANTSPQNNDYNLVQLGGGSYRLSKAQ